MQCAVTTCRWHVSRFWRRPLLQRRRDRGCEQSTRAPRAHPRQELGGGRPHPRRAPGARHPAEGRQGPGHRRAHHDLGGEAVRGRVSAERLAGQRPPLSCRTSPPQGGDWPAATFANLRRGDRASTSCRSSPSVRGDVRQDRGAHIEHEPRVMQREVPLCRTPCQPKPRECRSRCARDDRCRAEALERISRASIDGLGFPEASADWPVTSSTSPARSQKLIVEVDGIAACRSRQAPTADATACASGIERRWLDRPALLERRHACAISTMSASTS